MTIEALRQVEGLSVTQRLLRLRPTKAEAVVLAGAFIGCAFFWIGTTFTAVRTQFGAAQFSNADPAAVEQIARSADERVAQIDAQIGEMRARITQIDANTAERLAMRQKLQAQQAEAQRQSEAEAQQQAERQAQAEAAQKAAELEAQQRAAEAKLRTAPTQPRATAPTQPAQPKRKPTAESVL